MSGYAEIMEEGKKDGSYSSKQTPIRTDKSDADKDMEADFFVLKHTARGRGTEYGTHKNEFYHQQHQHRLPVIRLVQNAAYNESSAAYVVPDENIDDGNDCEKQHKGYPRG